MVTSSQNTLGKMCSALVPISLFVLSGLEHCVANMAYVPLAFNVDSVLLSSGVSATFLDFLALNLFPVTLGNTLGGTTFAYFIWLSQKS